VSHPPAAEGVKVSRAGPRRCKGPRRRPVWLRFATLDQKHRNQCDGQASPDRQRPPRPSADVSIVDAEGREFIAGLEVGQFGHATIPSMLENGRDSSIKLPQNGEFFAYTVGGNY